MSLLSAPSLSLALALMLVQKASSGITISSPSAPLPPPPPPLPSHLPHPPLSSLSLTSSLSLPSPPSPSHPSLSSPSSPLLPSPPSPLHPSLSSSPLSPPHPSLSSSPLSPHSPPLSLPSPPLLPPVSTHTIYHDSAIAFNQVTLARILQELEDRDVLSQDTGFRRVDTGASSDPQLTPMSHLNHLATIAQGIQHMSANVDNITHVLSSVILHIYPDLEVRERPSKIPEGGTAPEEPSSDARNRAEDLWMSEEQGAVVDWNVGAEVLNLERKNEETREKIRQAEERLRELRAAVEERAAAVEVEGDENTVLGEILGDLAGSGAGGEPGVAGRSSALLQDVEALKHAVADALTQKQSLQDASSEMRERNAWLTSRGEQAASRRRSSGERGQLEENIAVLRRQKAEIDEEVARTRQVKLTIERERNKGGQRYRELIGMIQTLMRYEPDLGQTSEAPQTDSPAVLRRTRNKSLSTEQKDADSERVPSRSLEPQGQQAEFRERGGPSQLEFLRATSDLLKSELEQSEIESHHLNLNLSQLEMEAQRLRERGHQLLGVRANDTEEERKLMRASLLEAAKLKKQLEEDLRDLQRDRDELERQNRDLAKHNEVLEKRESEIEEEIQREEQREVALYRERNSLAEATKKALLDKVILDQDVARLEQEKRKYRELTRGMARRVYELEARCRAKN